MTILEKLNMSYSYTDLLKSNVDIKLLEFLSPVVTLWLISFIS